MSSLISIQIKKKTITLSQFEQGLANAANARSALEPQFQSAIAARTVDSQFSLMIAEPTLERMIVKYSEQLVFQPLEEIRYWFTFASGAFLEPGYPPLFYARDKNRSVSPNKSAVAAIGEGIAGFVAQRAYRCRKLARPNHDYPDIVMEDMGRERTYLVEAKATMLVLNEQIELVVDNELPRFASLLSGCRQLDVRPIVGLLIGTALRSETEYDGYMLEIQLT